MCGFGTREMVRKEQLAILGLVQNGVKVLLVWVYTLLQKIGPLAFSL